jgi:Fic family protein
MTQWISSIRNVFPIPFVPKGTSYSDEEDKIRSESRNGIIQAQYVLHKASEWSASDRVTPELVLKLQELAVTQIYRCAGYFRDGPVSINEATHQPPDHKEVGALVAQMCEYLNNNWQAAPVHLAAYTMWRVNWIHPFFGGNGRTARALSYLLLSAKLGFVIPGTKTIPELIVENRDPYFESLRKADNSWGDGTVDVSAMEELMASLLAQQLVIVHQQATGKKDGGVS